MSNKQLIVNITEQRADLFVDEMLLWMAPVSTSSLGLGEEPDSYKTPRGVHHVAEKIGGDAPSGTIFKSRKPTGKVWVPSEAVESSNDEDLVLSRIIWLAGDEARNASSYERYIYIHGTNHEDLIGRPASKGCIRLKNQDVIALYDWVDVGTRVEIVEV